MVVLNKRQIPPWELYSRISYRRWKDGKNKQKLKFKHLYNLFKHYENGILPEFGDTHLLMNITQDYDAVNKIERILAPYISNISLRFQQLAHTPLRSHQAKLCLTILKSLESTLIHIPTDSIFKLLVSYSKLVNSRVYIQPNFNLSNSFNLKFGSLQITNKLFNYLEEKRFEICANNVYPLVESYIRLCVGYGQDADTFLNIYKNSMQLIINGNIKLNMADYDRLLLLFERMGIYDRSFIEHYSNKITSSFAKFSENQIGNLCRYMTKLPFVEPEFKATHLDLLKPSSIFRNSGNEKQLPHLQYAKRLPRHYIRTLLSRRCYDFKPKVDYSVSLAEEDQNRILKLWDFKNSSFIKTLNRRLPYVLHQYTYFNLIDVAEMFYIYGIESDLLARFSTELWKYLYTLKYGYPLKSLIVLSCLKQGDAVTYGRLIRNIPATLCFNWPPELVAEALIACGSLGIKKPSIYFKLSQYLQSRILYFSDPNLVCRLFESLSLAESPQYGIYNQLVTLSESFPDWLRLKHLVSIARSCSIVGILETRLFRLITSRLNQVSECSVGELIPIIGISSKVKLDGDDSRDFYKFILHFIENINSNHTVSYEELVDLLKGMVSIQVRTSEIERLAVNVLKDSEDSVDIVRIVKYFSILGKIESKELLQILSSHIENGLKQFDEFDLSSLIWDMISVGFGLYSGVLLEVVRKFTQLRPRNFNTHLLTVVGTLIRLGDGNNLIWKDFLKIVEEYKDYSWSKSEQNLNIIKGVANTIKDSSTFVQQFPYTIDIAAMYKNIDITHIYGSSITAESTNICTIKKEMMENNDVKFESESSSTETDDNENNVALFYYDNQQNPFVTHISTDGKYEQHFNFYYQTRKSILQSKGWKDTLIFSPNN